MKAHHDALMEAQRYQQPTIGELIGMYRTYMIEQRGNKEKSVRDAVYRLERFFIDQNLLIGEITERHVQALYDILREAKLSVDSHRGMLAGVKTFFRWCVENGHLPSNPAENVKGVGKCKKGKPQLRPGEANLFFNRALELSNADNDGALAALMALMMGLRASEITKRIVRDVDMFSGKLFVEDGKTNKSNRQVKIPEELRPAIMQRLRGKQPTDPLLHSKKSEDGYYWPDWVTDNVKRICTDLGLPVVVCAHGLRGTHSTLAQESGETASAVAKMLGHEDEKTTKEHYTAPGVGDRLNQERALRVLTGGRDD